MNTDEPLARRRTSTGDQADAFVMGTELCRRGFDVAPVCALVAGLILAVALAVGSIGSGGTIGGPTTTETWRTTVADGTIAQSPDINVYTVILQSDAWKIAADRNPTSRLLQPPRSPGVSSTMSASATQTRRGQSPNLAGDAATGSTVTAVSRRWTIPNVDSETDRSVAATWIGIGRVSSTDLIQTDTDVTVGSGLLANTAWGSVSTEASRTVPLPVNAGDKVSVAITQQVDGRWQILIRDVTTGQTYQTSARSQFSRSSGESIKESPTVGSRSVVPLDHFGSVSFTEVTTTENRQQQPIKQADRQTTILYGTTWQALAEPSSLGPDGESFTVARTNATTSAPESGTEALP